MNINNQQNEDFSQHESWDDELLWKEIEQELDKDKQRGLFFWFAFAAAIVFIGTFSLFNRSISSADINSALNPETVESAQNPNPRQHKNIQDDEPDFDASQVIKEGRTKTSTIPFHTKTKKDKTKSISFASQTNDYKTKLTKLADEYKIHSANTDASTYSAAHTLKPAAYTLKNEQTNTLDLLAGLQPVLIYEREKIIEQGLGSGFHVPHPSKRNRGFLSFQTGIGAISEQQQQNQSTWATRINEAERPLYTHNTSINYAFPVFHNFHLESGISDHRQINRFEAIVSDTTYNEVMSDTAVIVNSSPLSGYLTQTRITKTTYSVYNRINTLTLPLSIGYLCQKGRHSYNLSAGLNFNLSYSLKGNTYSPQDEIISLADKSKTEVKFLSLQSASFSLDYGRDISGNYSLFIGGRFSAPLREAYKLQINSESYNPSYVSYNLYIGVRKRLQN